MFYNKTVLNELSEKFMGLYNKYLLEYDSVIQNIYESDETIWCKGFEEPFHADYFGEIEAGNTRQWRKILEKAPKKISFHSKHSFLNKKPTHSLFYDDDGKVVVEKIFIHLENEILGLEYCLPANNRLRCISIEYKDENCNTIGYDVASVREVSTLLPPFEKSLLMMKLLPLAGVSSAEEFTPIKTMRIDSNRYVYNDNVITNVSRIEEFNPNREVHFYNDEMYRYFLEDRVSPVLKGLPPINPESMHDYEIHYGDDGIAETYTRTNYCLFDRISYLNPKMNKNLMKKYIDYGITCFKIKSE